MASIMKLSVILLIIALSLYPLKYYMNGPVCESDARLDGMVAIVTGANTGIGKETAMDLLRRGARVIMGCRSMERCEKAAIYMLNVTGVPDNRLVAGYLDLSSFASIREFAKQFKYNETRLDILVNNAGVAWQPPDRKSVDGYEIMFAVNHLGTFLLTNSLVDKLIESTPSRVVTVASDAHELMSGFDFDLPYSEENKYFSLVQYGYSKLGNVLFSRELGRKLNGTGVTTYSLHPGIIQTDITRDIVFMNYEFVQTCIAIVSWPFLKDLYHGAQTQICCAVDPALASQTAKYYSDVTEKEPSAGAQNDADARRLWDMSVELVKLSPEEIHPKLR